MVTGGFDKPKINSSAEIRDQSSGVMMDGMNPKSFQQYVREKKWKVPLPYPLI
ncbi:hypothetical protein CEXT_522491, partial [Caerostris extrusa]